MTDIVLDVPRISASSDDLRVAADIERQIEERISAICADFKLPRVRAHKAVEALVRTDEIAMQNSSELPPFAPELYENRPRMSLRDNRARKRENITEFLRRVWKPWMDGGILTRADLRRLDPSADKAVENWILRKHALPPDINLPCFPKRRAHAA